MKRFLTIIAIFMTMLCGSVLLVSCSKGYDKMYLEVEYAVPTADGEDVKWNKVSAGSNFDYFLSDEVYSQSDMSHILWLRIKVKGTSKKVNSLYISQSANNSTFLEKTTVKPGEAFKVKVENIGSVRFTVTPSQGGESKVMSFGVNIYKELTGISQNADCVPAVVTGGFIMLENLTNLIQYAPIGETNQTGVNFSIEGVGTLIDDGTDNLINRTFRNNANYEVQGDALVSIFDNETALISFDRQSNLLMLNISTDYKLTNQNNVIKLKATSKYHEDITTDVYVYIVENFKADSLLVSYSKDITLTDGKLPDDITVSQPIGDDIVIYNSSVADLSTDIEFNAIEMYTYTNASIYSYESSPGMQLNVFINGVRYDYNDVVNDAFGVQVSPIINSGSGVDKLVGLKFEVNPNSSSTTNVYNVRLELDFTAFNFGVSGEKSPVSVLNKEFTITVENLASGFHINGKGYGENLQSVLNGATSTITAYGSTQAAKLYTTYSSSALGMPLNIQATPTNAINTKVYVGFYENITDGTELGTSIINKVQLLQPSGTSVPIVNNQFEIDFAKKDRVIYLAFNETENIQNLKQIYMVCRVVATPDSFREQIIAPEYVTFVACIDVVGAVQDIGVYKNIDNGELLDDEYLATSTIDKPYNVAYIKFNSNSLDVDYSEIEILSLRENIKYSADGSIWTNNVTADMLTFVQGKSGMYKKLYFKVEKQCTDTIIINSPNGVANQIEYKFVNVTSGMEEVEVTYEDTYMWTSNIADTVGIKNVTDGEIVSLKYLALQSGRTTQFKASGDGKTNTIKSVEAKSLYNTSIEYNSIIKGGNSLYNSTISTFSATAISVKTYNNIDGTSSYLFDISANNIGFTSVLYVKVSFYLDIDGEIQEQCKYFIYEIAVYTPARELRVNTDKDEIIYINENYIDSAIVNFNIELNSATRRIAFSSSLVNNSINLDYYGSGVSSIYGISVLPLENVTDEYFRLNNLKEFDKVKTGELFVDNSTSTRKFSVQALQNLRQLENDTGATSIAFEIAIYQFGQIVETTKVTKVIYFGDYNSADSIIVVSGVEGYSNIYLSLLGGNATRVVEAYASSSQGEVTYKDLGYKLYQEDVNTGEWLPYSGSDLTVDHDINENTFTINASNQGGVYQLELYTKDSGTAEPKLIKITVSDGRTSETAYLIKDLNDFVKLADNTQDDSGNPYYYRLWQDIDISALNSTEWWSKSRQFAGHLDGAMTIEDLNTGKSIYKCYSLMGLNVSQNALLEDANCFGLFNVVTGTIQNVVFESVVIDITLGENAEGKNNTSSTAPTSIGAITAINSGVIENCSVNINSSSITFSTSAQNSTYNIGLIAGLNNNIIKYAHTNFGSNYSHMVDVSIIDSTSGKLTITLIQGNTKFTNTNLYIGGVVGQNANGATISANYEDKSSKEVRELISAVVNIKLVAQYNDSYAPANIDNLGLGGIAGYNIGTIQNIAVSGSIVANDKANIGGIAGINAGSINESANYGAYIEGNVYIADYVYTDQNGVSKTNIYHGYTGDTTTINQEQNIGGIVGINNAGTVDNVRVIFIKFNKDEVAVCAQQTNIIGVGNVGGIIGKATNTKLQRAYVENFVNDEDEVTFNIIGNNGANVAGLIADINDDPSKDATSAILSFVQADFDVEGCVFYEFGQDLDYSYVYFIGDVLVLKGDISNDKLIAHNHAGTNSYIINNIMHQQGNVYIKIVAEDGLDNIEVIPEENYATAGDTTAIYGYTIQWRQSVKEAVNNNQPYLWYSITDDGEIIVATETLTISPTDLIVNVDKDYFGDDELVDDKYKVYDNSGIYMQYEKTDATDKRIVATAIVYYVEGDNNTHTLVSEGSQKGLIEKTILPTIADDNYAVSIVSGSSIATIGGSTITFNGVGKVELRFVSLFDRTKTDTVTIFVENPLHEDVFTINASSGLEDRNQNGERFTTQVGVNSIISVDIKDVDGQTFDSAKTYMTATVGEGKAVVEGKEESIANLSEYFTLTAITEEIVKGSGKYVLGQFNVSAIKLDTKHSYMEIPVTIKVYLNLENYYIGDTSLSTLMDNASILLEERTITIVVYNKATGLTISSDVKAEAGEDIDVVAKLTTGYVDIDDKNASGNARGQVIGEKGEKLVLNTIVNHDKVEVTLTPINENAIGLLEKAKQNGSGAVSVWDLFDRYISYELLKDASGNSIGYTYSVNLRLLDEYRYLDLEGYTEREWKFKVTITASSNTSLSQSVEISFVPQSLIGLRLENYSNLVATAGEINGTTEANEFVSNQAESSLIIPGSSGLIKIFADYEYSYFEDISITSSRELIDGKEYFIRYQQLVYNKNKEVYESYAGITADGETLNLKKVSYIEDGEYKYDGVIFVRTILEEIVGIRKTFTITVNANTYDLDGNVIPVSRNKIVISQYRPGVNISVENALIDEKGDTQVYLIEQNSSVSTIVARVHGYEFNVEPKASIYPVNEGDNIDGQVTLTQQGTVEQDATGAYVIRYSVSAYTTKPFKVVMDMMLIDSGNTLTNSSKELVFYPVPYIVSGVYLKGEANGGLSVAVNSSKNIELVWSTNSTTNAKIDNINTQISDLDYLKLFYIDTINTSGQNDEKYFSEYLNATDTSFAIKQNADGTYRIESLIKVSPITVHFEVWYGYDMSGSQAKVVFSETETITCSYLMSHEFKLHLIMRTTEDAPNPISTAEDFMSMSEGENYILMEDITLENWTPINTAIASLDGNGKLINIKSFNIAVTASLNVGLFASVSSNTILKNIVVNIATMESDFVYIKDDNVTNSTINFGVLAGINEGLIYNCEVISVGTTQTLEVVIGNGYNLTFGGLVGVNQGNITNSRVGTEYFERLVYSSGSVYSAIVDCGQIKFKSKGVIAGFAGQNIANSIITSSFVANTSVENTSVGNEANNRTAGFVATNAGLIAYSYVKGYERNILTTKSTTNSVNDGIQSEIKATGNGSVAGFAYMNSGEIHDCYSNTICKSNSAGVAGFVYNTVNGSVYQCYSASKVESGNTSTTLVTELPFVGVGIDKDEAQDLLSSANMLNCYYYNDGTDYDMNYSLPAGRTEPRGLSLESFANSNNLNNFSFINANATEQQLNGVWTYSTAVDRNRSTYPLSTLALPELTSANTISRSLRVYADNVDASSEEKSYVYPVGYELGSKKNPYIIRSVDEYKSVFVDNAATTQGKRYLTGYVRFIDDISFGVDSDYINIDTRSNYILGDKEGNTFTLIDGNGMTISDVVINYTEEEKGNLGLFSEIYTGVIKGLNIEYSTQTNGDENEVGSSTATYVGGVAGIAHNTYFIDLNLSGSVTLRAHNVVGGVVGKLTGVNSGIYNVSSNLSVQAGNYSNGNVYNGEDSEVAYLSYAGGVAGIIDIGPNNINDSTFNINKLNVISANVRANRAGGIAGYMGKNVNAKRMTYATSVDSQIFGREVAGGMVADNYADIQLSQISGANDNTQYEYDSAFGKYINNDNLLQINTKDSSYGNLNAITGNEIVGGFIGINYNGTIINSLTKANIGHNDDYGMADIAGGFIGKAYGGNLEYVYAQNYIDLVYEIYDADGGFITDNTSVVGGIVGYAAYNSSDKSGSQSFGMSNVVSANWFDKTQIDKFAEIKSANSSNKYINLDYLVGQKDNNVKICQDSSNPDSSPIVNYGVFNASADDESMYEDGKIRNSYVDEATYYNMEELYYVPGGDTTTGQSTQQDIFNTLFAIWPEIYWSKDYTKFMPNLKLDNSVDYIIIDDANDVKLMELMPDKNFMLVKDVIVEDENFIVDADFRGILIGTQTESEERYTRFYVTLNANTQNHSNSGFFRQTTGARIANIGFNYDKFTLSGEEFNLVGGVSAYDTNSRFEQVTVTQSSNGITTLGGASLVTIGSIVAQGYDSKIISCTSSLGYDLSVMNVGSNNTTKAYIGGLVGWIDGEGEPTEDGTESKASYEGLISSSVYSGQITVLGDEGVYIGGIVAYARYARISDSKAMQSNNDDTTLDIDVYNANHNYIGGIVANSDMCSVAYCSSDIAINDRTIKSDTPTIDTTSTIYYVGGIVGTIVNPLKADKDIDESYSRITFNVVKASDVYLGGIVGVQLADSVQINKVVSEINIKSNEGTSARTVGQDLIGRMTLGGIVALADKISPKYTYSTNISDVVAIMNCDVEYNSKLIGGGLIGQATGSYSINNSTSMGYIWANNLKDTHINTTNSSSLTVLGGLVGLASLEDGGVITDTLINQSINNSYTVLTLSTANVYKDSITQTSGLTHVAYTNAIVGYTSTNNVIEGNGILYSSDYVLALDKDNSSNPNTIAKFANAPQNVTANILINSDTTLKSKDNKTSYDINGYIGDSWLWQQGCLPLPLGVQDLLYQMGIVTYDNNANVVYNNLHKGKAYYPIVIANQNEFNNITSFGGDNYRYYLLLTDIKCDTTKSDLNGVLLGNNNVITSTVVLFDTIGRHSAVSNLTFILDDDEFSYGAVAATNNGTIFMCGVQYENIDVTNRFGGLVSVNNGVISNCYNQGNANVVANAYVGGLAYSSSENASIEDSYFTGSFSAGEEGAALVCYNKGFMANSYSAGMAEVVVNFDEDATDRYEKVFYDYYANYVTETQYDAWFTKGLTGLSTQELQSYTGENSTVLSGWKVYSMYNWSEVGKDIDSTYNYGYPIHNIEQLVYNDQVQPIQVRVKRTGNGEFIEIKISDNYGVENNVKLKDGSGNYIANNITYVNSIVKGKLVYDNLSDVSYDNRSFLINNLGVLDLINTFTSTSGLYFELELDMVMPDGKTGFKESNGQLITNWRGIGSGDAPFRGVFTTSSQPDDFISAELKVEAYLLDSALSTIKDAKLAHTGNITLNENPKVITNLTGGALFNCIDKGALIANVVLENSRANYAPVVNIVGTDKVDEDISEATLYKVSLKTKVIANNDRLAGFVNHVEEDNTLNIHSIATGENILLNANGLAGTVAGVVNTNNGTINVKNSFSETTIQVERVEGKTVAGFINSNNGTINLYSPVGLNLTTSDNLSAISGFATNNAGTICQASEETIVTNEGVLIQNSAVNFGKIGITTDYIAGLVGNMTDGSITGFDISFTGMPDSTYSTKMFGGAVASMSGGTLGDDNQSINISYMNATGSDQNWIIAEVFGGVVAEVDGDSASLKNIILNVEKGINISGSDADDSAAYGMIIGKYLFALNEIYYSITKDIVLHVANGANVGGVIGYATASSFNFTNSQDSDLNGKLVKVYGKKNVGGFIGHCKGTSALQLKEESSLWAIGQDNIFAQVGVAIPKTSSTGVTSFIAENFGGLIGYWDSTSTLSCSVNGQSQQLVNINEIISDNNFILGASGNIDGVVTNIGGIVGKCSADITNARNEGNIGTDLSREEQVHKGLNPLYTTQVGTTEINGTISSLMKFMYVGGIVGCVDTTNKSITISACSNVGNIQGVYAVGGIVGGAPNKSSVTVNEIDESNPDAITLSAISSKAPTIMGLADVGGIIGRADTFTYKGYQGVIANNVIGVANVGGVVGNSTNTTINNCVVGDNSVKTMITGNYNVGGFAGYVEALRMNVSLTEGSTSSSGYTASIQNVMVNGSVYDRVLGEKVYYYLPTNIGGAVGYISGSANIYNINTSAEVRTDDTFIIETRDDGNNSEVTVSLALTYVATNESNIKNNEYHRTGSSLLSYLNAYYETSSIRTDKVDGGIGGFAGKLKDSGEGISFNSCNIATDVYAPLGINVGGIIGYLPNDPLLTKLPTITKSGSVNVVGKIFVGGYIGKTAGFGSETKSFFGNDGVVDKISSINVQQYYVRDENNNITDKTGVMAGNCVGGIIGYVAGHAYNIHLTSNDMSGSKSLIKVFNSNGNSIDSTYVGTLIGRLDGTMSNCSIASELCDAIPTDESSLYYKYSYDGDIQGIIQTPKMYNYGGLVGLVNTSGNVEIYGKHYYAFTVDILQSTNFGTDGAVYSYDYDEDASTLTAIAHYVNNGKINISVSGLTALYDGVDTSDNHNPTNQYASGWAKEYTLFRTFAYKKDQADASTGDHVQTIYSANYIMAVVATMGEYNIDNGSSTTSLQLSQEIVYTIYQPSNQSARMYTKYGIATQDSDFDPAYTSVESAGLGGGNHFYEFNYQLSLEGAEWVIYKNDTNKKFFDIHKQEPLNNKYGDVTQISGRNAFVKHLEDPTELGLTDQYKWDEKKGQFVIRETWDEDLSIICANLQYSFGYSYYVVDNYLGEGSTYFIFDVVFGDSSSLAMHCKEGDFEALLDNQSGINIPAIQVSGEEEFSASGSIFDVRGTASGVFATGIKDSQFGWKIGGIIVAAIIAIVAIILSNGLLAPILKGLATAVGAVKGAVSSFIAALVAKWGTSVAYFTISALCAIAAGSLGNIVFSAINNGTVAVEQQFSMIIDKEMGYLTQSYSHSISWNDGQMQFTSDAYRPSLVTVKLNGKNGSITTIASKPSEWTNYRWFLYENTLKGNTSPQLMFYYYSISTARSAPANINSQATVSIADLPSDSDLYMILNAMNVESVTIPRFQIIEDELYSYSASEVTGKILAPNYVYEKQRATNGTISETDLISDSGYAYLRLVGNETIVVPETETNWMINEYNQARIIKRSFESKITSGLNNKYPVDLSKLKWIVDMSSPTANADAQKEIFGDLYKGVTFTKTSEPPIDGTYYVQIDQDYYVYDTNGSVRLYVIPYVDNSGSGNGLTATQVGVSGDYQYVHLGTEDVSTGFYSEEFEYALYYPNDSDSFIKAKVSNISNNGMAYKLTEIGAGVTEAETDQLLKMVELTMYSFNPGANSNTVSGFFGNAEKKTLLDIRDNWDTYKTYSFSNQYYSPVSDLYDVQNGILYQKETCISYMTEFGKSADGTPTEQQYLYIPQYGSIENEIGFNDKFIYNSNGKKLYTRFNYGSDFLSTEVSYITGYDENGNPITDKQSIGNILMPKDDGVSTPCVFAESCRVSFNGYTTIAPNLNNLG